LLVFIAYSIADIGVFPWLSNLFNLLRLHAVSRDMLDLTARPDEFPNRHGRDLKRKDRSGAML
jgi:hypothetical protein